MCLQTGDFLQKRGAAPGSGYANGSDTWRLGPTHQRPQEEGALLGSRVWALGMWQGWPGPTCGRVVTWGPNEGTPLPRPRSQRCCSCPPPAPPGPPPCARGAAVLPCARLRPGSGAEGGTSEGSAVSTAGQYSLKTTLLLDRVSQQNHRIILKNEKKK